MRLPLLVLLFCFFAPLPALAAGDAPKLPGIIDKLDQAQHFQTFRRLLTETGLSITLDSDAGYTVFAPSDAAFAAFPAKKLAFLEEPEHRDRLKTLLQRHIAIKKWTMPDLQNKQITLETMGEPIHFDGVKAPPTIEGVALEGDPIGTRASIIYPIGGVIASTDKHLYDEE